jgi:hypothetical protein
MHLKILQMAAEGEEPKILDEVEIEGIDPASITPINENVGTLLTFKDLLGLLSRAHALNTPADADAYYARTPAWIDLNLMKESTEVPHHIGFRLVANSVLQKYAGQENLRIEVS